MSAQRKPERRSFPTPEMVEKRTPLRLKLRRLKNPVRAIALAVNLTAGDVRIRAVGTKANIVRWIKGDEIEWLTEA